MRILETNLTLAEGVQKEGEYLENYRRNGWRILNRAKTGGIGLIARNKWSKRTCREEALKYRTRGEFAKQCSGAYEVARSNGWLDSYTWLEEKQKPAGYWDSYDNCYKAAKTCRTKTEFIKLYNAAYVSARNNGWLEDYFWFAIKKVAHNKKWDFDTVFEEAKKYKSRKEFSNKARGAYKVACQNKWLDLYDWFGHTNDLISEKLKSSWNRRKKESNKGIASLFDEY